MRWTMVGLAALLIGASAADARMYFYLGGGATLINIDSDYPAIGQQNTSGFQVTGGVRWDHFGLELDVGGAQLDTGETSDIYYPPDSAEYAIIDYGARYYLRTPDQGRLIPWMGVGLGVHIISWDTYWYNFDGSGYSLSAGVDYRLIRNLYLRSNIKYHSFTSNDNYNHGSYDSTTLEGDLGVIWLFGGNYRK